MADSQSNAKYPKNPICAIVWHDAAYSYAKKLPKEMPKPQLTTGFIISANEKFINIATNVAYDENEKKIKAIDGFIIPITARKEFRKIGYFNV
jgi:hypothetical protein